MNSLLKVLCSILNNRLVEHAKQLSLINPEQIGFPENAKTSDHILTLKTLVNKYVTDRKRKKLFACFIDFKKEFDSIWLNALFKRLENNNINGNFLWIYIKILNVESKLIIKLQIYFIVKNG